MGRTVAIQFVRSTIDLAPQGLDVDHVLRTAGISAALLREDSARVTEVQASRLIQALWQVTGDEMIGLGPRSIPRGTFRMVTLGLIHTADLRTALRRFIEFAGIGIGFRVKEADDAHHTHMFFDPGGRTKTDQLALAIGMVVGHRFAAWLIGQQIALTSVELPDPAPPHVAEFPLIFGVMPTFEAPRAVLTFDSRHLSAPLVRTEEELVAFIGNLPAALLFRQDYNPSTSSRVRRMIERRSTESLVVEDVAKPLNISAQHLRRLLRDEGTTFRQIKEDILRDEAIAALVRGRETVEELSVRLGFSEPSAFRRAFRRWTGSPPGAYRHGVSD
ncbi:AraC family transcriptional regulator [Mycobacterium antarcticum]|uniref:AraC family transcriptional regulator n=1 Tax=Mycolicibacterium sp. TUM20985 TaxID=3023370 RepID=UPI0025742A0E|nr:AraC family transcriptional regulator [Mycolicibacterium sp. TUM20985]